ISCRATQPSAIDNAQMNEATGEWGCAGDSGWCKFFLAWSQWNQKVISILSGSWAFPETERPGVSLQGGRKVDFTGEDGLNVVDQDALKGSFDPRKSLISSLATGCLPGIFAGIEKYRQLRCEWLMCMKVNVAYGSMSIHECDDLFNYGVCRYVLGEIWNVVPFYQWANEVRDIFVDVASNPLLLIGYVADFACTKYCTSGSAGDGCPICSSISFINVAMQFAANVAGVAKGDFWTAPTEDICEEALKDEPSYSNLPGFPSESDPEQEENPYEITEETET
ncbi:hypothetical protein KY349_02100, partial [Candidatus Woesearchaeota archaeon]|nr:hypothetical protein [Candidatus Woesearchaeota archaeon]